MSTRYNNDTSEIEKIGITVPNNTLLVENAYNYILDQILNGKIKPGDRIREDIIAEQLETSRTPVREAVNQLCQNGFIHNVKRKGLYCVQISREELIDLLELRLVLEDYCYAKCADKATKEDIARLNQYIDAFMALPKDEQLANHEKYDIQFHLMTAEMTGSQRLTKYINEIETCLLIVRKNLKNSSRKEEVVDLSWLLHKNIVKAMELKDKGLLQELNREHIKLMKDTQLI